MLQQILPPLVGVLLMVMTLLAIIAGAIWSCLAPVEDFEPIEAERLPQEGLDLIATLEESGFHLEGPVQRPTGPLASFDLVPLLHEQMPAYALIYAPERVTPQAEESQNAPLWGNLPAPEDSLVGTELITPLAERGYLVSTNRPAGLTQAVAPPEVFVQRAEPKTTPRELMNLHQRGLSFLGGYGLRPQAFGEADRSDSGAMRAFEDLSRRRLSSFRRRPGRAILRALFVRGAVHQPLHEQAAARRKLEAMGRSGDLERTVT